MKAMVFAAGLGTRLKPFTNHHPKALAEVCGQAMLGRVIEKLKSAGVVEMAVNVHHFADQIVDYLQHNGNFGIDIQISDETEKLLDTGGGLLYARRWLDGEEDIIVHNADILTDFNIDRMIEEHRRSEAAASLLVASRQTSRYLLFDADMTMMGWTNIDKGTTRPDSLKSPEGLRRLAFGGVHVISPRMFHVLEAYASGIAADGIDGVPAFSIMDFYIDNCRELSIRGHVPSNPYSWYDIGRPESLADAQKWLERF